MLTGYLADLCAGWLWDTGRGAKAFPIPQRLRKQRRHFRRRQGLIATGAVEAGEAGDCIRVAASIIKLGT